MSTNAERAPTGARSHPDMTLLCQSYFVRSFLHLARNNLRSFACKPFASACFEHSIEIAVRDFAVAVVDAIGFGVIVPAAAEPEAGAVVAAVANTVLADRTLRAIPMMSKLRILSSFRLHLLLSACLINIT